MRQKPPLVQPGADAVIEAESSLVLIPTHVTKEDGQSVQNLRKENFRITENEVEQQITHFTQDDAPVSVALLLDTSGSMRPKVAKAVEAALAFFRTSNPQDEVLLVEFSDRAKVCVPFTRDFDEITERIRKTRPFGKTALLDAVHVGLRAMKTAQYERKALVIISDGGDNWSWHTGREVRAELRESNVQVFSMGIFEDGEKINAEEERMGPVLLAELASTSGGTHYPVKRLDDLPSVSAKLGNELRNEYVLGYYPQNTVHDGRYHPVRVELLISRSPSHLHTAYRRGYYAPAASIPN